MRKPVPIVVAALLVAILGGLVWLVLRPYEPVYQGKRLSVWLQGLNDPPGSGPLDGELKMLYGGWNSGWSPEKGEAVKEALRHMGPRVVPALRKMIRYRDTPFRLKFKAVVARQGLIQFHFKSESEIHLEAAAGCQLAESAIKTQLIGDWIKLLEEKENRASSDALQVTSSCFGRANRRNLGLEACGPLLQAFTNGNTQMRVCTVGALSQFPSEAKVIVPVLLASMDRDPHGGVRYNATVALKAMLPKAVLPVLLREVTSPSSNLRIASIGAISTFTNEAPSIVPALLNALEDDDCKVREAITNALKRLDPAAATRAGIE